MSAVSVSHGQAAAVAAAAAGTATGAASSGAVAAPAVAALQGLLVAARGARTCEGPLGLLADLCDVAVRRKMIQLSRLI